MISAHATQDFDGGGGWGGSRPIVRRLGNLDGSYSRICFWCGAENVVAQIDTSMQVEKSTALAPGSATSSTFYVPGMLKELRLFRAPQDTNIGTLYPLGDLGVPQGSRGGIAGRARTVREQISRRL